VKKAKKRKGFVHFLHTGTDRTRKRLSGGYSLCYINALSASCC